MQLQIGDVLKWDNFPDKDPANQKTNWFVVLYPCPDLPTLLRFTTKNPKGDRLEISTNVAKCLQKNSFVFDRHIKSNIPTALINRRHSDISHYEKCVKGNEIRAILNNIQLRMPQDRYEHLKKMKNTF